MADTNDLYSQYLTNYFSALNDPTRERHRKIAYLRKNYGPLLPQSRSSRILEIGPGHGELLELLMSMGYTNIMGVDLSREVADYCNSRLHDSTIVVNDTAQFLWQQLETYDEIFMLHVLEHVPKPQVISLLKAARGALVSGGILFVEVPNMGEPLVALNSRYADFTHEVGFTETSLAFVLRKAGFGRFIIKDVQLPDDHWYRPIQRMLRMGFDWAFKVMQRALAVRGSRLTAPAIMAQAMRE